MADVKWVKVYTDMFDVSRKIKQIERMPQGDTIIIIWFKLLLLAGKINDGGAIYITQSYPYDIEGLADELRREPKIVEKALSVFEMFDMIDRSNGFIYISSWEEYQNIEGLDKIREQNRLRKQKQREKQKQLEDVSRDSHGTVTESHAIDIEEDKEKERDKEELSDDNSIKKKPVRHKYGEYSNVLLSDDDMEKLKTEFPHDWEDRIERLSSYIASTGKSYKNHLATIRNWARKDTPKAQTSKKENSTDDFMNKLKSMYQSN